MSEHQYAVRAMKAGASGYLTKESAADELVAAIRASPPEERTSARRRPSVSCTTLRSAPGRRRTLCFPTGNSRFSS